MNLRLLKRAIDRTLDIKPLVAYERFLREVCERGDAWIVSQGEFVTWWQQRASGDLNINVRNRICHVKIDLSNAIIENYPGEFHTSPELTIQCPDSSFDGLVLITIDKNLNQPRSERTLQNFVRSPWINGPDSYTTSIMKEW